MRLKIKSLRNGLLCGVLFLLPVCAPAQAVREERPAVITTNRPTESQIRRTFQFAETGVHASNDFDGARLNEFVHDGGATYSALIKPENAPINNSAWYAFKIWSASNQTVQVRLTYENGRHRYVPRLSRDGAQWQAIEASHYNRDEGAATLTLQIGPEPLYVAGQEMFVSKDFQRWIRTMARRPFIRAGVIGDSTRGKPIHKLEITEAGDDADYLVLISRQHPPEVTGTFGLLAFVETIADDSELARAFRKRFTTIVIPLVNPDGVDAGHWRHNVHGVDLNRDWGQFNQQETRVVRDELLRIRQTGAKIRFGLDFHSTQRDVFYTLTGAPSDGGVDFTLADKWLGELQARLPDYKVNISPTSSRSTGMTLVSTAWMQRELNTPAVTYEVGDQTDRAVIRTVAATSATVLMELLLDGASHR